MTKFWSKRTAICILASLLSTCLTAGASTMAITGMKRMTTIYDANRRNAPSDVSRGDEASIACMVVVFLDWQEMYSPALSVFTPLERNSSAFTDFSEAAQAARDTLNEIFDANRPRLSQTIRQTLDDLRAEDKAPAKPERLSLEDIQDNLLTKNLLFCKTKDFLAKITELVPPTGSPGQALVRTLTVEVPDLKTSASSYSLYTPAHKERVKISRSYEEWIKILAGDF